MAFTQIRLDTLECGDDKYIVVDDPVSTVLKPGDELRFFNQLSGNPDATVRFYPADGKGGSEIGGFCTEMTGTELDVPGTGAPTVCTTTIDGTFAYDVTASPTHEPLDPIIIIKPDFGAYLTSPPQSDTGIFPGGEFSAYALLALSAPLFIGILGGIYIGRKMG